MMEAKLNSPLSLQNSKPKPFQIGQPTYPQYAFLHSVLGWGVYPQVFSL